jgi:signal transduction histidine kinase
MKNDRSERLLLTREALISVANLYPSKQVSIYPALDVLHLYIQRPVAVSFVKLGARGRRPSFVFSSFRDPELRQELRKTLDRDLAGIEPTPLPDSPYGMLVHRTTTVDGGLQFKFNTSDTREIGHLLKQTAKEPRGKAVLEWVTQGLEALERSPLPEAAGPEEHARILSELGGLSEEELQELKAPLRTVVDDAFADILDVPLLRQAAGKTLPFSNLFCVVRTATLPHLRRGRYPYTAHLLLANAQREQLKEYFGTRDGVGETLCNALELPLGTTARSIADSVFASGVIDFSHEQAGGGRDFADTGAADQERQAAEARVYDSISDQPNVFMVPIHVSGIPWLALFTLTPRQRVDEDDSERWMHNYQVYRTLIPGIAGRLRVGAKRAYIRAVTSALTSELDQGNERTMAARLNLAWRRLSMVYPFTPPRVASAPLTNCVGEELPLPSGTKLWLSMESQHPVFSQHVDYEMLSQQEIAKECREAIARYRETWFEKLSAAQRQMSYMIAHDVRGTLDHSVINPLTSLRNHAAENPELQRMIEEVIARAGHVRMNLRFWLDAVAEFEGSSHSLQSIFLNAATLRELLDPAALSLGQIGALPPIEVRYSGPEADVRVSSKALTALFRIIIENAVIAMGECSLDPAAQRVRVTAAASDRDRICRFSVWNSGTVFPPHVLAQAGERRYQAGPSKYGSGLGLMILERILRSAGAPQQPRQRHFLLANTRDPIGARVSFSLPTRIDSS